MLPEENISCTHTEKRHICFPEIHPFDFKIHYGVTNRKCHVHEIDLHTHSECEIYINLTGDVSFMVENRLYPLTRGDVILCRPGEFHHCVYRSDAQHAMFWILFSGEPNRNLLDLFYGENHVNFISPAKEGKRELIDLCFRLHKEELAPMDMYTLFFRMQEILRNGTTNKVSLKEPIPKELADALAYMEQHITESLQAANMAEALHCSESTIERLFRKHLKITPFALIRKKKMLLAASLLRNGETVLNTGLQVGYSDNSHFIKLFRQYYGMTPLQYQKKREEKTPAENNSDLYPTAEK